jgi:hypothetical protein
VVAKFILVLVFHAIKDIGVIASLAQLHEHVLVLRIQPQITCLLQDDILVEPNLKGCQTDAHIDFNLVGQFVN